ncbi:MAG: N-acetylmuramoyl-L-alanine amidase [Candidatus Zixiibacteriota bacterium]
MLWRSTFPVRLLISLILSVVAVSSVMGASLKPDDINDVNAQIKIIHPKPNQLVASVDSAFILGNVPAENDGQAYKLFINDQFVPVHPNGGFIAFLPIAPDTFQFHLEAYLVEKDRYKDLNGTSSKNDILSIHIQRALTKTLSVVVPKPMQTLPMDSTVFDREINLPSGDIVMTSGDRFKVEFRGTPGRAAWFGIPGVIDSVPMAELEPQMQQFFGESVFGAGGVPESLKVAGVYSGFYDIPPGVQCDTVRLNYCLGQLGVRELLHRFWLPPYEHDDRMLSMLLSMTDTTCADTISSYRVSINGPDYPFTVRFMDSVQIIRYAPRMGYFAIFQPKGVEALAVGAEADWYRIQLSKTQFAWVQKNSVEILPKGILPPSSYLASVRTYDSTGSLLFEFPLTGKHPFRVFEDDPKTLRIQLFGVTSNTDWIRYDFADTLVDIATWSQPENGVYEFKIHLRHDIWGYDTFYRGNTFYFQLNKAPEDLNDIEDKIIVIDPGHSKDSGAIGPTGYTEAEANLAIALKVAEKLQSRGAIVVLTREDMSDLPLYDRPTIAKIVDADLFVSIHNNALPDRINPFQNNGSSTYYYHPHSIGLARAIQKALVPKTELRDFGLYHGNLAVNRPTQYPAVLVECAFMILPEQEALLKTDKFRERIAEAITDGIEEFLKEAHNVRK